MYVCMCEQIPIRYFQEEEAEVVHGVGTLSSSRTVSGHSKGAREKPSAKERVHYPMH